MELLVPDFPEGTATLVEDLDKRLMVMLRDGRTLIGYLRSVDQFANLVLHRTIERIYVGKQYGDMTVGVFIVRGENVALLGEVDTEKEINQRVNEVPVDEILIAQRKEQENKQARIKTKKDIKLHFGPSYGTDLISDDLF